MFFAVVIWNVTQTQDMYQINLLSDDFNIVCIYGKRTWARDRSYRSLYKVQYHLYEAIISVNLIKWWTMQSFINPCIRYVARHLQVMVKCH